MNVLSSDCWWSNRGIKMALREQTHDVVVIANKAAETRISRTAEPEWWQIDWKIKFTRGEAHGTLRMNSDELRAAFALSQGPCDQHYSSKFKADAGVPYCFLREKNYLNIPGPGHQGYGVAVSIEVDGAMKEAIKTLLSN